MEKGDKIKAVTLVPLKVYPLTLRWFGYTIKGSHFVLKVFASRHIGLLCKKVFNTELNGSRKIVCLRKSEVSVERISVCNVIENLAERNIHCLSCSFSDDVINYSP